MVFAFWRRQPNAKIEALYGAIVAQARAPAFYADCGVDDTLAGRFESPGSIVPPELLALFEPNDKTNLALYRILHFVALSILVVRFVPGDGALLQSRALRPAIICGERSLEVFCVGIFLSFVGHFVLEIYYEGLIGQVAVSVGGIAILTLVAAYRSWSRTLDRQPISKSASARDDGSNKLESSP